MCEALLEPQSPAFSWSRTSSRMAQWAQERLLQKCMNVVYPDKIVEEPVKFELTGTLDLIDIGKDRLINTLVLKHDANVSPGPKKTLVMMHGYGAGLGFFYKVCTLGRDLGQNFASLAQVPGYRVLALDWLGMANSSRPPFPKMIGSSVIERVEHTESFFIESLEDWRRANKIDQMTLMGEM